VALFNVEEKEKSREKMVFFTQGKTWSLDNFA
jgi:hypothetical protein